MLRHHDREGIIWNSPYGAYTKLLLLALNSFVDGNGECWPSVETLITMTGMSKNSILRHFKRLTTDRVIKTVNRFDGAGRQTSNNYRIDFAELGRVPQRDPGGEGATVARGRVPQRDPGGATVRPPEGATVAPDLSIEDLSNELIQNEEEKTPLFGSNDFVLKLPEIEPETIDAEIVDFDSEEGTSHPDYVKNSDIEIKSSGAPIAFSGSHSDFYAAYNRLKPALWASITTDTQTRSRCLKTLVTQCGSKTAAMAMFEDALSYCRQDDWWGGKSMTIDNILRSNRIVELAEKWRIIAANPIVKQVADQLADPARARHEREMAISREAIAKMNRDRREGKNV